MKLIFVADPMCSWCYGFAKELASVLQDDTTLSLDIVVGGLRAGGTELLDAAGKQFRLSHWGRVEAVSGVPFNREALMTREGFVDDTEPVCRCVVAARRIAPDAPQLPIFRALQRAFYVDGLDTTDPIVLARVTAEALTSAGWPTSAEEALARYRDRGTMEEARDDFLQARRWGIRSFPALLANVAGELHLLTPGFVNVSGIRDAIDSLRRRVSSTALH